MKVCVFGAGYVGLITSACLAETGNSVVCLDIDAARVEGLQQGRMPIHEAGLESMVRRSAAAGRLVFTTDAASAVTHGTVVFIAVGTPAAEDGSADAEHVLAAARSIGRHRHDYKVVVDKSTVPVCTAARVHAAIVQELSRRQIALPSAVVSNPGFLNEGAAVEDFMKPDRVIIGCDDERTGLLIRVVYAPFLRNRDRILLLDARSAELTKYVSNAMLGLAHQLHERTLGSGRTRRCRHRAGAARHRQRPAHRHGLPLRRLRLGRLLPAQGREGPAPHRH